MKLKTFFYQLIGVLLLVAAAAVFLASFFTTIYYDMHVDVDQPLYKKETSIHLVISMIVVFALLFFLHAKKLFESSKVIVLSLCFCVAYCLLLILSIKPLPVDDSKLIDDVLARFAQGDYASLTEPGGYLYIWPFQLGYVLFGQIMDAIFGHGNYFAWDIAQVISILLTVYLLYKITWELFEDKVTSSIMAFLSMGMLFFYNYSAFIYGDILSMAPQTLALYLTILYVKKERIGYAIGAAFAIGIAVVLKTNCEITLIAMIMVLVLSAFKNSSVGLPKRLLIRVAMAAFAVIVVVAMKGAVDKYYCYKAGIDEIPSGSPSVSHIAMGLQESELEDGWYNGYNYKVFADNGYDTELTRAAATKDLKERLSFFADNPRTAIKFFARKFITQWADPVCISTHNLDLVSRHVENPTALKDFLVFGTGSVGLRWIMNVFMSVCYLCVVVYLAVKIRKRDFNEQEMLLLILIFGGMVFHEFWEGSSRYAMRYYVYWMPYAAFGMKVLLGMISKIRIGASRS